MTILKGCKLTYFGIPGRGEASRLALSIGGIDFEDHRVEFKEWPTLKPQTPWGSLPFLTLPNAGGESPVVVAQQRAVLRLIGKETGLYPTDDSIKAALVDSLMDVVEDVGSKMNSQGQGLGQAEKEAARATAIAKDGVVYGILEKIDSFIGTHGSSGCVVGDSLTIDDLFLFASTGALVSGLYDGVPLDAMDGSDFPNITGMRKAVRSHPAVCKWYDH